MAENRNIKIIVNHQEDTPNWVEVVEVNAICGTIDGVEVGIHHSYTGGGFSCTHLYYGLAICKNVADEDAAYALAKERLFDPELRSSEAEQTAYFLNLLKKQNISYPINEYGKDSKR